MDTTAIVGLILIVIQIIILEGILSIDNAAVLGALVSVLPTNKPVPYPRPFKFMERFTNRYLGMQQSAALKVGLLGAYAGQALMLSLAAWISQNPFLKFLGAAYLIKLAFESLCKNSKEEVELNIERRLQTSTVIGVSFWVIVLRVELSDLAFSLDNVVAVIILAHNLPPALQIWALVLGVGLAIILLRFAATIFTWIIKREPIVEQAAYLVVLGIGVQLLLSEFYGVHFEDWEKFFFSVSIILVCVIYAHLKFLHRLVPVLDWFARGMGHINAFVDWVIEPIIAIIKLFFGLIRRTIGGMSYSVPTVQTHPHSDREEHPAIRMK
jgi:tellurite resistance protein TerC